MASADVESGYNVPISDPISEYEPRHFGDMFRGRGRGRGGRGGRGRGGRGIDFYGPRFPSPYGNQGVHHPPMDPRIDDDSSPSSSTPFDAFDPRFMDMMNDMHDFWGAQGFSGDQHQRAQCPPRFRPPHPDRPYPPRPFGPYHHRYPYSRGWRQNTQCPQRTGEKHDDEKEFKVTVNISQFEPEDIKVKIIDGHVQIQGKHEEREDQQGFVTREFTRRYQLPDDVDPGSVKSSLGLRGLLTVFAPRKREESSECDAHEVPIDIDPKSPAPEADASDNAD